MTASVEAPSNGRTATASHGTADGRAPDGKRDIPVKVVVHSAPAFREAQAAVEHLGEHGVPHSAIRVQGTGLRWVPGVDRGVAAARMAGAGAGLGAVIGLVMWVLSLHDASVGPFILAMVGAGAGGLTGFLAGAWRHWWTSDDERVPRTGRVAAARYDVLVAEEHAAPARAAIERD